MKTVERLTELDALVKKWREAGDQARNKLVDVVFNGCADELECVLLKSWFRMDSDD